MILLIILLTILTNPERAAVVSRDQVRYTVPVLQEYRVTANLGIFVTDNAELNDTAIRHILVTIRPDIKDTDLHRARCLGYIINLAVKAFLFSKDVKAFKQVVNSVDNTMSMDSDIIKKV